MSRLLGRSGLLLTILLTAASGCKRPAARTTHGGEAQSGQHQAGDPADQQAGESLAPRESAVAWRTAVEPKPLSNGVLEGLAWLAKHQLESGGWGQGDESQQMGGGQALRDVANVADTSMTLLAFVRAGNTPSKGTYKDTVRRGIEFVLAEIEESDADSLFVTDVRGTRVQSKIGTYVDTFTALMVLTETKGTMPTAAGNARLDRALEKVLAKVEKNQHGDGTWANQGWAPVLTQSLAGKGLNRAEQAGYDVDDEVLARVEKQAQAQYSGGGFASGKAAGVDLYAGAASTSALRDSVNTRKTKKQALEQRAKSAPSADVRAAAQQELEETAAAERSADEVQAALVQRLDEPAFVRGFGNNGGEEFLSYMLVSESLVAKGGDEWKEWDADITKLVLGVQNGDGSWSGHHCITGRTFCTAAALLVLLADRAPVPVAAQIAR